MECEYCHKQLANKESLRKHIRENAACLKVQGKDVKMRYICSQEGCQCGGKGFPKKGQLEAHVNNFLGKKPYECPEEGCQKSFAAKYLLDRHVKGNHAVKQQKQYVCDICHSSFSWPSGLSTHKKWRHTNAPKRCCPFEDCNYEAISKDALDKHLKSSKHYSVKDHVCEICCLAFVQKSSLTSHISRVHDKEKRFTCGLCSKSFYARQGLTDHQRTHKDDRTFVCEYPGCGAAFKTARCLRGHRDDIHKQKRAYVCTICGETCQRTSNLRDHMLFHLKEKPFVCTYFMCGDMFSRKQNLERHIQRFHTAEGQAKKKKQEERVAKFLEKNGINFRREHRISFECFSSESERKYARIDFVIDIRGSLIFLEVDEGCHRFGYDPGCDMRRMTYVMQGLALGGNTLPICFLRYNPDGFKVDGVTRRTTKKVREEALLRFLEGFKTDSNKPLRIKYLFYDAVTHGNKEIPQVLLDPSYNEHLKQCVEY